MSAPAAPQIPNPTAKAHPQGRYLARLSLLALGVVYGDIGTSPLYALQQAFHGQHGIPVTPGNVLGVLSLIFWSLLLIVTVKYHVVIIRAVVGAVIPTHAIRFLADDPGRGLLVLGAVFLVVTGGEALYADLGHFGHTAIQLAWFTIPLPALMLNYFGQGALLLTNPEAAANPFYLLAPAKLLIPLIPLATAAAIIASQAVISGAFSLTRQAVQLGYIPRMEIEHTSSREIGQIYVPSVNKMLAVLTIALVLYFHTASNLAGAYGVALSTLMALTTVMFYVMSREAWGWSFAKASVA